MPCQQQYTESLVREILEYSEGDRGEKNAKYEEVETIYGKVRFLVNSDEQTGHALQRHLTISPEGLRTRTMAQGTPSRVPGIAAQDLDQASAFKKDDWESLLKVVAAVLNSTEGQQGLGYLDLYEAQGKTRIALVVDAAVIGCQHVNVRVFYQDGKSGTKSERLQQVCVVVDSNLGGKYPIKIVTAFPCKGDPKLEVGLSSVMVQSLNLKATLTDPASTYWDLVRAQLSRPRNRITTKLLSGNSLKIGKEFNSAWIKPNPDFYETSAFAPPKYVNWGVLEPLIEAFCTTNNLRYMTRQSDSAVLTTTKAPV